MTVKYKVSDFAKDLSISAKKVLDELNAMGSTGKKNSSTLEENELNFLLEKFSKDNSVNRGEDCVKIDNVAFSGDAGMADGDVDGDGIVSVSDALLAMRGAMGTITLTASQLAHADLDGDGTVTASDALAIMRMAMNG